jgi:hypothetical protein
LVDLLDDELVPLEGVGLLVVVLLEIEVEKLSKHINQVL